MQTESERDQRFMTLFRAALDQGGRDRWEPFVRSACAGDSELERELLDHLERHVRMGDFLAGPLIPRVESAHPFAPGDLIADRFRVVRQVGEGGMAVVYEAIDEKLVERRAIKCPLPGFRRQLPPEARHAMRVTHPNVCRVYEIHSTATAGGPMDILSMEFVEGETLAARLDRDRPGPEEALEIACQLCQGLDAAHREQLLHRDLKPNNIMLARTSDDRPRAVIMDFGLAQQAGSSEASASGSSGLRGAPDYIAPERWKGDTATVASDVYALGVLLHELATGKLPFDAGIPWEIRLNRPPPALRLSHPWNTVVTRCLAPDPAARYRTAADVALALRPSSPSRRQWLGMAALALVSFSYAAYRLWPVTPDPPARLAILPFQIDPNALDLAGVVNGALHELPSRLGSLSGSRRRVVPIPLAESLRYKVDEASALGKLGATHVLSGSVTKSGGAMHVRAVVTDLQSRVRVDQVAGDLAADQVGNLPVSLAGLVTRSFHLAQVIPARISVAAQAPYLQAVALLRRDTVSHQEVLALLEEASRIDSSSPLIQAAMAEAWLQAYFAGRDVRLLQPATDAATRAQSLHPDSVPVLLLMGTLERASGRPESSLSFFRRAGEMEPNNSEVWRKVGGAHQDVALYNEAIAALRKSIALDPAYYAPHLDLGFTYFRMGRYAEAAVEYRAVNRTAPDLAIGYNYLGAMLLTSGRADDEAERAFRRSLELGPSRTAWNNLGVLRIYHRQDSEAIRDFGEALRIGPDAAVLRINLADACRRLDRRAEALAHYRKALEMSQMEVGQNPRDAQVRAMLGYVLTRLGAPDRARFEIGQAVRMVPADSQVVRFAAMGFEALGDRNQALAVVEGCSPEILGDLSRQPDLALFSQDPRFIRLQARGSSR